MPVDAGNGAEVVRSGAADQNVRRVFHDPAGESNGVADVLHAGHRAAGESASVHDRGVHLVGSDEREDGTAAGVEARIVLQRGDDVLDHLKARFAGGQLLGAQGQGFPQSPVVVLGVGRGAIRAAGAAVNRQSPARFRCLSGRPRRSAIDSTAAVPDRAVRRRRRVPCMPRSPGPERRRRGCGGSVLSPEGRSRRSRAPVSWTVLCENRTPSDTLRGEPRQGITRPRPAGGDAHRPSTRELWDIIRPRWLTTDPSRSTGTSGIRTSSGRRSVRPTSPCVTAGSCRS